MARNKRYEKLFQLDQEKLLAELGRARDTSCRASGQLKYGCDLYRKLEALHAAIDDIAEHMTGNRRLFHAVCATTYGNSTSNLVRAEQENHSELPQSDSQPVDK